MGEVVADVLTRVIGASAIESTTVACDHNHVRREVHFDQEFWVHRKGAMSARQDEAGILPGSMGTESYHVEGRGLFAGVRLGKVG